MTPVPVITARELIRVLRSLDFEQVGSKDSHRRFIHPDGRKTTVPVHTGRDLPRGLLRKIVSQDIEMDMAEFVARLRD